MNFRIITIFIIGLLFSCKKDAGHNKKIQEYQKSNQTFKYHYIVNNDAKLYKSSSMENTIIDTLDFLEPVEILEKHKELQERVVYMGQNYKRYVCKIKALNGKVGFIYNDDFETYDKLSKRFNMKSLDEKSININGKLSKAEGMLRLFESFDDKPFKKYSYTIANRLSLRTEPLANAKRITVLKYLEPLEIIEDYPNKIVIINDEEDGVIKGNWCKVKLLNGIEGYTFNGYIKSYDELPNSKLIPKGIERDELLINGKLKTTTTLNRFLDVMGKPDSIKSYILEEKIVKREYKNGTLYIEHNIDGDYGGWVYDDLKMKYYYKNGIEYEELNGEVGFSNIDFTVNNNFLKYNGIKIDSTTSLKKITELFPIQAIEKPRMSYDNGFPLFEFGYIREKKGGSEVSWQLHCDDNKTVYFCVYWYD